MDRGCPDDQMNTFRIALANIRFPATPEESVMLAEQAIAQTGPMVFGVAAPCITDLSLDPNRTRTIRP
jgi:hypothetical protein